MYLNYKEFSLEFDPDAFTFELLWRGDVFLAAERMRIVDRAGREHHLGAVAVLQQPLRVELLINEFPYDHRIDDGDDRSLRRCKDTAVNTAKNDDRNEQRPEGVFEGLPYCRESWTF